MKILITGGLGYVGGRLSTYLLDQGHDVRIQSRRSAGFPEWAEGHVASGDPADLCEGVEVILHLAGSNEIEAAKYPEMARRDTVEATERLLMAAKAAGVEKLIYVSTAHVYGAPLVGVIDEDMDPHPAHPYAVVNLDAEMVVAASDMKTVIFRLSNAYGTPRDIHINRWTLIVNDLCRQAVETGKLVLKSSGLQQRDFVPLSDVCAAVSHFLQDGEGLFNLGGGGSMSIIAMAELVASRCQAVLGFTPPIERPELIPNETAPALDYRTDRLKAAGFSPAGDMAAEIDATLKFCKDAFPSP